MAAFDELDWGRFDVWSIVCTNGVIVVEPHDRQRANTWLSDQGHSIRSIDFGLGVGAAATQFGRLFEWEHQFGYALGPDRRSLDALRDGFGFGMDSERGHVLELLAADTGFCEDPKWVLGVLAIASEYSLKQLALGRRFFAMMVLGRGTKLMGAQYDALKINGAFRHWHPAIKQDD